MPLNIDWKQILLHLFNFVLLFGILFFLLYNPVKKFMDKRVQYYKDMDDETKKKKDDAEELKKLYEEKLSVVDKEIAEKRQQADESVAEERRLQMEQAAKEAEEIRQKARADGEAEKKKIIDDAQIEIIDRVTEICKKSITGDSSEAMDGFLSSVNEDAHD